MPSAQGLLGQPAGEQPVVQIHLVHFPLPSLSALPCPCLEPLGLALVIALCWSACPFMERANPALLASLILVCGEFHKSAGAKTILGTLWLPRVFSSLSLSWTIVEQMVLRSLKTHWCRALFAEESSLHAPGFVPGRRCLVNTAGPNMPHHQPPFNFIAKKKIPSVACRSTLFHLRRWIGRKGFSFSGSVGFHFHENIFIGEVT